MVVEQVPRKKRKVLPIILGAIAFVIIFCVLLIFTFYAQVGGNPRPSGDVRNEDTILLHEYLGQIEPLYEQYKSIQKQYDAVSSDEFTNYESLLTTLRDEIIPNSQKLISEATDIIPETELAKEIHALFLSAINLQDEGFSELLSVTEEMDVSKLREPMKKIQAAQDIMDECGEMLLELISELFYNLQAF